MSTPKTKPRAKLAFRPQRPGPSSRTALEFLSRIWAAHPHGFVFLAALTLDGQWIEKGFHVAFGWRGIKQFIRDHDPSSHDLYYCPNPFRLRKRRADYALSTRLAWCDIDGSDPNAFRPQPSVLVETSPRRYQGLWRFSTAVEPDRAEAVSRHLTNTYHGDRGGWSITKMLRLPGTLNHKRAYDVPRVKVLRSDERVISVWPKVKMAERREAPTGEIDPTKFDADAVIQKYKAALAPNRRRLMQHTSVQNRDRSRIVFMIVAALHDAGATPNEIAAVVWRSPYFISKHGDNLFRLNQEVNRILSKIGTPQ
jgi:RepB DNA-primase from phage plasmid